MTSNELLKALKGTPFVPFRLNLADGRSLTVHHPEFLMLSPNGRTAAIYPHAEGEEPGLEVIDVLMVQSIKFLPVRGQRTPRRKAG